MNTGTPLDLTPFGVLLTGIGTLYWIFALAIAAVAWRIPRRRWLKVVSALTALTVLIYPIASYQYKRRQQIAVFKVRKNEALALFEKRCQGAGERVVRTVNNVDGVLWMKWRPRLLNYDDQFRLDDPYGQSCGEEECIANLLRATKGAELDPQKRLPHHGGFRFVESIDPNDGQLYRYTLQIYRPADRDPSWLASVVRAELIKSPISKPTAMYGVTWNDVSTREDRDHWIAGGSLTIVDLNTNEVIGERIGYLIDSGLGDLGGARTPWTWARRHGPFCPTITDHNEIFVTKVLKPNQMEE